MVEGIRVAEFDFRGQQQETWHSGAKPEEDTAEEHLLVIGVSTDTRSIQPGNLFIPIAGATFDGHDYLATAVQNGAVAALWQKDKPIPANAPPLILVEDTVIALQRLARSYRRQLPLRVVGITGSNGKTTTKDLTAAALAVAFRTHKTPGNFNNHIGLPLTLLQMDEGTEVAVIEMGMSERGEIERLASIAEPDIVVITNIGESHLLQLGSREEIARAKTEALSGLREGGLLVYNGDEPLIAQVLPEMIKPASLQVIRFGMNKDNDLYPLNIQIEQDGTRFLVNASGDTRFFIPLPGKHNAQNAVAAYAVARHLGLGDEQIAQGLAAAVMTGMRIERMITPQGTIILNDAYNASPASTRAALHLLSELQVEGRKIAVLGDMLELGEHEAAYHEAIGEAAAAAGIEKLYAYGPLSHHLAERAAAIMPAGTVQHYADKAELIQELTSFALAQDAILVKGSRGMKLEHVVQALMKE
ncbi:MAG: UDP-N-acetylmuramoyl-tripeptide--D-alanyl-D-alanine ligase [Gorillibacterium sp.]|nr:UDP-N-acetylmuramoyl-tripeptide--D-alanyl-D-alanine ligase [Gorillibacterium sp.]